MSVVATALDLWGLTGAKTTLIAQRENHVYRVETSPGYALRLHRPGYRSTAELESELRWMAALDLAGLCLAAPVPSRRGQLIEAVAAHHVSMLRWEPGVPMGASPQADTLFALGYAMAEMHKASDRWLTPDGFVRPRWDFDGLIGPAPVWGAFWQAPHLTEAEQSELRDFRAIAAHRLGALSTQDQGLIHADLIGDNVLVRGSDLVLLDFDDSGWGFRLFDLATTICHLVPTVNVQPLLDGYRSTRPIDSAELSLFLALRAATYVGWIADRLQEPGAEARAARMTKRALTAVRAYVNGVDRLGGRPSR